MHVSKSNVCRSLHTQALKGHENFQNKVKVIERTKCYSRDQVVQVVITIYFYFFLKILMSIWGFRIYVHVHSVKI